MSGEASPILAVLTPNHPIFSRLQSLLKVPYRVFFTNRDELNRWLKNRNFVPVDEELWDDPTEEEWINGSPPKGMMELLKIDACMFDEEGRLVSEVQWKDDLVRRDLKPTGVDDDDVPF